MVLIFQLEDEIYLVLDYINENGGFIAIVWYKQGEINNHITDTINGN